MDPIRKEYHRASGNSFNALLYFFSQIEMLTERATPPVILAVILVALSVSPISLAKAVEVCALSHGTDGTQVLIPDPQSSIPESAICSSAKAVEASLSR